MVRATQRPINNPFRRQLSVQYCPMLARRIVRYLAAAVVTASGVGAALLYVPTVPSASAQPCPDVQVVFARGTGEPPGVGPTGQAFVDSLRTRVGGRSLEVYP